MLYGLLSSNYIWNPIQKNESGYSAKKSFEEVFWEVVLNDVLRQICRQMPHIFCCLGV